MCHIASQQSSNFSGQNNFKAAAITTIFWTTCNDVRPTIENIVDYQTDGVPACILCFWVLSSRWDLWFSSATTMPPESAGINESQPRAILIQVFGDTLTSNSVTDSHLMCMEGISLIILLSCKFECKCFEPGTWELVFYLVREATQPSRTLIIMRVCCSPPAFE